MDNPLVISLAVTGVGMLMLFLALAVLYGLMYAMTAVIKDRPEAGAAEQGSRGAEEQGGRGAEEERVMRRRAAAIAVALARAERELGRIGTPGAEETTASPWRVSAWRALHHQRQLTHKLPARRVR